MLESSFWRTFRSQEKFIINRIGTKDMAYVLSRLFTQGEVLCTQMHRC